MRPSIKRLESFSWTIARISFMMAPPGTASPPPGHRARMGRIPTGPGYRQPLPDRTRRPPRLCRNASTTSWISRCTSATARRASITRIRSGSFRARDKNPSRTRSWKASASRSSRSPPSHRSGGPPPAPDGRLQVEQQGKVRDEAPGRDRVDVPHDLDPEAAPRALVGEGGIHVAVAYDQRAAGEGGGDHLGDELRAGRGEEEHLRPGRHRPVARIEQERADPLADLGPARLAQVQHLAPGGTEVRHEQAGLRGLPRALGAFEGEEDAPRAAGGGHRATIGDR